MALRRKSSRDKAKAIAERKFLYRKASRKVSGILMECPDIGQKIEEFVKERSVGADAWRRTGVLTFDGNKQVKEKVTYERIQSYLQEIYQRKISYGTVVQLCCARNKRRLSAKRYKGVHRSPVDVLAKVLNSVTTLISIGALLLSRATGCN